MAEYYKLVGDEKEVKWYYDHMLRDLKPGESWMLCLGARDKKLTEEEKLVYKLGRSEMMDEHIVRYHHVGEQYKYFIENIYKFETRKEGLTTAAGIPYPDKCLVVYFTVNPCSSLGCVRDTQIYADKLDREFIDSAIKGSAKGIEDHTFKYSKVFDHLKSVHARNPSERILIDFDVDTDLNWLTEEQQEMLFHQLSEDTVKVFPKRTFAFIRTSGGFHVNVKKSALKSNPNDYVKILQQRMGICNIPSTEIKYNLNVTEDDFGNRRQASPMIPCPGTIAYSKQKDGNYEPMVIHVINKWDFE